MTTEQWLTQLHGKSPGHFVVSAFTPAGVRSAAFTADQIPDAAATISKAAPKVDVYVSCATFDPAPDTSKGERGTASSVCSIPGVWLDLDVGTVGHSERANGLPNPPDVDTGMTVLEHAGIPEPSYVIHTGGGAQLWWLFDEPLTGTPEQLAAVSLGWTSARAKDFAEVGYGLDSLGDLARILRPAGTFNHKTGTPRGVEVSGGSQIRYELYNDSEPALSGYLDDDVDTRAPAERETAELLDMDLFDVFTSEVSWADILEPHGWSYVGQSGKGERWLRPGKPEQGGHSALCGRYAMVCFSETAGLPVGAGANLTKFRVWAHMNHNGDEKKAARELRDQVRGRG